MMEGALPERNGDLSATNVNHSDFLSSLNYSDSEVDLEIQLGEGQS